VAAVSIAVIYGLRRRERRAWTGIDADPKRDEGRWKLMPEQDPWGMEDESPLPGPGVQMAAGPWTGTKRQNRGLLGLGGIVGLAAYGDRDRGRRDMLADEDAYQYDIDSAFHRGEGPGSTAQRPKWGREDTGNTSVSYKTANWDTVWNTSAASFRNVGTALGLRPSGTAAAREGKGEYVNPPQWWEKTDISLEPFTDEAVENMPIGVHDQPMRPRGGELSESKSSNPYVDPFSDDNETNDDDDDDSRGLLRPSQDGARSDKSLPSIPEGTILARVSTNSSDPSEETGKSNESHPSSYYTANSANSGGLKSNKSAGLLSTTSSLSSPISPRSTSIFGANIASSGQPIRRSDTWWARFSRTPFLDRHSYDPIRRRKSDGTATLPEFRDPNPVPKLVPIEERSPQSPEGNSPSNYKGIRAGKGKGKEGSGDSASVKTGRTANTDLIEHLDGRVEVVQRALSKSSRRTISTGGTISDDGHLRNSDRRSWTASSYDDSIIESPVEGVVRVSSPISGTPDVVERGDSNATGRLAGPRPPRSGETGAVAARITAFEKRMSQDVVPHDGPRSPTTRKDRPAYGLAPKASLFVANPDQGDHFPNPSS